MRLLADENVGRALVLALRESGHEVEWIGEQARRTRDVAVFRLARTRDAILLTYDKAFGRLALEATGPHPGVILLRTRASTGPALRNRLVVAALGSRMDWRGHLSIIDETRIRMIRLQR